MDKLPWRKWWDLWISPLPSAEISDTCQSSAAMNWYLVVTIVKIFCMKSIRGFSLNALELPFWIRKLSIMKITSIFWILFIILFISLITYRFVHSITLLPFFLFSYLIRLFAYSLFKNFSSVIADKTLGVKINPKFFCFQTTRCRFLQLANNAKY